MSEQTDKSSAKGIAGKNIALLVLVIAITVIPLVYQSKAEFSGSDDQAEGAITEINKDYKPWFSPVWEPPSGEIESLLFALQAGIGCLVIGYYIGYVRGCKKNEDPEKS